MVKRKSTYNNLQSNTQKDRQHNGRHYIVCPPVYCFVDCCMYFFFWPLYCLSFCVLFCRLLFVLFLLAIVLSVLKQYTEGQTIQWPKEKVHTTIYKTIHRMTDNTMAKRKSTYNNLQYCFVDCCLYFFFWPLCCLSFCVLFCRLLYVLFLLTIVLSVLLCIVL
jgi:hypothetical protein